MFSELKAYFQDMSVYKKIICVLCVFLSGYDLLAATVIRINYWVHYPMNLLIAALVICLTSMEKRGKVSIGYIFDAAIGLSAVFSIGYYMRCCSAQPSPPAMIRFSALSVSSSA